MPLVTTDQVVNTLINYLIKKGVDTEVYSDFPSDEDVVSEGIYVARLYQADRTINLGSIPGPKSLYTIVDAVEVYLVYGQQNPYIDTYLNVFSEFIDDAIFKMYSPREYKVDQVFQSGSERYRITLSLTRHQLT